MTLAIGSNSAWTIDDDATTYSPTGGGVQTAYGQVSSAGYIFDTDPTSTGLPYSAIAAFQPDILKLSAGNETYTCIIQGSKTSDFSANNIDLGSWPLTILNQQELMGFSTLSSFDNTVYRYIRLKKVLSGTLPSLKLLAFFRPLSDITPYTMTELIQLQVLTMQNILQAAASWMGWATGTVNGGIGSDGKYPVYDGFGHATYLYCPAQINANSVAGSFTNTTALDYANKVWTASYESTGLSLADRATGSLITVGYNGHYPAVADDDTYTHNAEALQAALDRGGVVRLPGPGKKIYMKDRVVYRPAWSTIDWNGSRLVFDNNSMFTDPSTLPNLVSSGASITVGTIANFNIWRVSGTTLQLIPVGPNLVPHPRLDDVSQYFQTSTGPLSNTTYTKASTDSAKGAYTTTFNGVTTLHPVQVIEAPSTQSGTAQFGEVCLVDASTHSNLQAFTVEAGKRYAFGAKVRLLTGVGTGIRVSAYFTNSGGSGIGGGSSAGLTVNGTSATGYTYTIVDSPAGSATATIIIDIDKTSASTAAALVSFDNWFFREIDSACNICPNYIDDVNNDGDYADVGIHIPELVSYPIVPMSSPATYVSGSRPLRFSVSFNVLEVDRVGTQNYLTIALRQGVGVGAGTSILSINDAGLVNWEAPAPSDIDPTVGGYLTFQSSNGIKIDKSSIVVKIVPDNWAILVQADSTDATFDQSPQLMHGGYIDGPNLSYAEGIVYDTPSTLSQASRGFLQNVQIFGFGVARKFRTQAYLIFDIGLTAIGLDCAEMGIPSANAGEQINSLFPVLSGGRVVHDNCFERRIFGGSSDYPTQHQFVVTSGTFETWGHHFEGDRPELNTQFPFTVTTGALRLHGGKIEHSGHNQNLAPQMISMFNTLDKYALVDMNFVEASNWFTSSDYLAQGPGRVHIRNTRGGDTKNITVFVKDDWRHNKFGAGGDCDGAAISVPMWVDGGDTRISMHEVHYSGTGGSSWKASHITTDFYAGSGCIAVDKTAVGSGTAANIYIWFRVPDVGLPGVKFMFKCPNDLGGTGTQYIFMDSYSCCLLDTDTPGVYQLADGWQNGFFGELDYAVNQAAGDTTWTQFRATGSRSDKSVDFDGYTAEGDNAILVIINCAAMPSGFRIQIDNLRGALI